MADQNTSLPIRSEADGLDERVLVKICDGTSPTVNQATVDADKNLHTEMHGNDPAGVDRVVRTSELGALTPDGVYHAANNTKPGNVGLIASERSTSPGDSTQTQRLTSVTNGTKRLLDVSIHDENGAAYSETNPMPVTMVDSEGDEVHSYSASANVAAGATVNLDYIISSGKTLKLKQVLASGSGKIRAEIQTSPDGTTFTTRSVWFNSTANTNIDWTLAVALSVTGTNSRVRVRITNRDNQPQDVYSTIIGYEI